MTKYELVVIDYLVLHFHIPGNFQVHCFYIYLHELEIFLNEASYILSRLSVTFHLITVGLIIFPLKTVSQQNCPPFETTF